MELESHKINLPEPGAPVPSHFWKVVCDKEKKTAVAFVILNDPYAVPGKDGLPTDKLCSAQCNFLLNVKNQTPARGILMCCSVDNLKRSGVSVPDIGFKAKDLFTSTDKAAINLGKALQRKIH